MRQLLLNQVTLCSDGSIGLQWLKLFVDPDTKEVLMSEPHRSVVDFDGDIDQQMGAVSAHLQGMGYPAITPDMVALVRKVDFVGRTDERIEATRNYKIAVKAAEAAKAEAEAAANAAPTADA